MPFPAETSHPRSLLHLPAGLLLLAAGTFSALAPGAAAASSSLSQELRRAGLEPLAQANQAPGFRLPLLSGGEASLADYRGRWVLLTFFATWCGPCRSELPSLEVLHREAQGSGLEVVSISIDQRRNVLPPFVRQLGLSFPVLWDGEGQIGSAYRASSIPVTYLIDPAGTLVAIARGARDWTRARDLIRALGGENHQLAAVSPPAAATLPPQAEIQPPEIRADFAQNPISLGEPLELAIRIQLPGDAADYLLKPPSLDLPEGLKEIGMSAESAGTGEANSPSSLSYHLRLEAEKPGRFELGQVRLRFQTRSSDEEQSVSAQLPTLEVLPATVAGRPPSQLTWAGFAAGALATASLFAWKLRSRRRARALLAAAPDKRIAPIEAALACARRERLEGRPTGEFLALAHAAKVLELESLPKAEIDRALERARYGNLAPTEVELAAIRRETELALAALRRSEERRAEERLKSVVLTPNLNPSPASLPARD